jgi:hypothetical protein
MTQNNNAVQTVIETPEQELARLRQENAKLKANKAVGGLKVTAKGGLSVYGMGRFPVTLYRSQWEALFERRDEILDFINQNRHMLAEKPAKAAKTEAPETQAPQSAKADLVDQIEQDQIEQA